MKILRLLRLGVCLTACLSGGGAAYANGLNAGDLAPEFNLPGSDGKNYRLSDFKGNKVVVLAWFPKAFTGG